MYNSFVIRAKLDSGNYMSRYSKIFHMYFQEIQPPRGKFKLQHNNSLQLGNAKNNLLKA